MSELKTTTSTTWTNGQAFALAAVSLLLGVCGGMLIRKFTAAPTPAQTVSAPVPSARPGQSLPASFAAAGGSTSSQDLKQAADTQAAPLLEQLKANPADAALLAQLGNLYYDAKQYPAAIGYYERSLKAQPADTSVRTDLGTAYWYNGDADAAIAQFNTALSYQPTKANALFNLGVVKWKGKNDPAGAIADWQKLLAANPGFEGRAKVEEMIAQAQASIAKKP